MASLSRKKCGGYELQFTIKKHRKTVFLGAISQGDAESYRDRVAAIVRAHNLEQPLTKADQKWLASLPDSVYEKLAQRGLVESRIVEKAPENRLSTLLIAFRSKKVAEGVKPKTLVRIDQVAKSLKSFFPRDPLIADIDHEQARAWQDWMRESGNQKSETGTLAPNTVHRRTGNAREAFKYAITKGWIRENPFSELTVTVRANDKRKVHVSLELSEQVMKCLPNLQWRLVFALARYAGLRCPSEVRELKWSDVDLQTRILTVTCVKTERYEGHDKRTVPIIEPLFSLLTEAKPPQDSPQDCPVIDMHGPNTSEAVYRRGLERYLKRAKIKPWTKLFQNLRASLENELLAAGYPIDTVCRIMGHSPDVALRHYAMKRDEEYSEIIASLELRASKAVLQKVLHSEAVSSDSEAVTKIEEPQEIQGNDTSCQSVTASEGSQEEGKNGRRGTRITIESLGISGVSQDRSAILSALSNLNPLEELIAIYQKLDESGREMLLDHARNLITLASSTITSEVRSVLAEVK